MNKGQSSCAFLVVGATRKRTGGEAPTSAEPLDGLDDLGRLGLGAGTEPLDDGAVGCDEELLEVPLDVARGALGVGGLGQFLVQRVPVLTVHLDLLEQRERDAVGGGAEGLDLFGGAGLLPHELVARDADHGQAAVGVVGGELFEALYCGVSPHFEATFTTRTARPSYSPREVGVPPSVLIPMF